MEARERERKQREREKEGGKKEEKERERDDNLSFIFPLPQRAFEQERQTREKEERLILSAWYNLVSNIHTHTLYCTHALCISTSPGTYSHCMTNISSSLTSRSNYRSDYSK